MEIPARLVAVYAPGLEPMDFHAVAEALIEGVWYVVDGTLLAPRRSLVRKPQGVTPPIPHSSRAMVLPLIWTR